LPRQSAPSKEPPLTRFQGELEHAPPLKFRFIASKYEGSLHSATGGIPHAAQFLQCCALFVAVAVANGYGLEASLWQVCH
jgi:hypothetical protein